MQAEFCRRDGTSLLIDVPEPPPETFTLCGVAVGAAPEAVGLLLSFPRRTYHRRPWTPGMMPVYDEYSNTGGVVEP